MHSKAGCQCGSIYSRPHSLPAWKRCMEAAVPILGARRRSVALHSLHALAIPGSHHTYLFVFYDSRPYGLKKTKFLWCTTVFYSLTNCLNSDDLQLKCCASLWKSARSVYPAPNMRLRLPASIILCQVIWICCIKISICHGMHLKDDI